MRTFKKIIKNLSKFFELMYVTVVPIFLITALIFPTYIDGLKSRFGKYTSILGAFATGIYIWFSFFSTLGLKGHILLAKIFGSKVDIVISIEYSAKSDNGSKNAYYDLEKTLEKHNGKSLAQIKDATHRYGNIKTIMNGNKYEFIFKCNPLPPNNGLTGKKALFDKCINVSRTCDYNDLSECWSVIDSLKQDLITSKGFAKDEYYRVSLLLSKDTPFYRFTIRDLENKKNKTLYKMRIPIKDGEVIIKRGENSPSRIVIESHSREYVKKALDKFFVELGNS